MSEVFPGVSDVCVRPIDRELIEQTAETPEMRDSTTCWKISSDSKPLVFSFRLPWIFRVKKMYQQIGTRSPLTVQRVDNFFNPLIRRCQVLPTVDLYK